jgi:ubiquinone/menaquinone biosynthesis C-methylase UbiE
MSFDILAPHYRWLELVSAGEKLQCCRTAHLARVPMARRILILGEGNGRFLVECHRQFPHATIIVVDASARMIELARNRLSRRGVEQNRIDFICADALTWESPTGAFDLIVTHFFLDCLRPDQLELLIPKLARAAAPNAHWLLADFQAAGSGWRRQRSRVILWLMYRFFIVATRLSARRLTAPDNLLERHGFKLRAREIYDWELLHSDWWQSVS